MQKIKPAGQSKQNSGCLRASCEASSPLAPSLPASPSFPSKFLMNLVEIVMEKLPLPSGPGGR